MKLLLTLLLSILVLYAKSNSCISCHQGVENIREPHSKMMKEIYQIAKETGYIGNDCIVCHGGNPTRYQKELAHRGTINYFKTHDGPKEFYPAPSSPSINKNTCGICHKEQVMAQNSSLMQSAAGTIRSALYSFAKDQIDRNHTTSDLEYYASYESENPKDKESRLGTEAYKKYMQDLALLEPQAFPKKMRQLPDSPTNIEVEEDPSSAVYTYLHHKVLSKTIAKESDNMNRGVGCAACHIPYSNDGLYRGGDKSIDKKEPRHLLVHTIQATRDAKVKVDAKEYTGVPLQNCTTCHSGTKSVASSYQGLIQANSKHYLHLQEDVHYKKGMLCQDCHTSNDMHGDGFASGANLAAVEIECQDCHGTTKKYPWELPIGYSDEFSEKEKSGKARGVTTFIAEYLKMGSVDDAHDGHLLSARGNPLVHTAKKGNRVILHLANGKDLELKPLKSLKKEKQLSKEALVAMDGIDAHRSKMECYSCHTLWVPQKYGSHLEVDYQGASAKVREEFLYMRWEDPALAQNAEGRVAPVTPDALNSITVVSKEGKKLLNNHTSKTLNSEGVEMSRASMTTLQPHSISKESRSCESCHTSQKAQGKGIAGLKYSGSKFLDENATQLMSMGHLRLERPLSKKQLSKLDRSGTCLSCHESIPDGNLAVSSMSHIAQMSGIEIDKEEHNSIMNKLLLLSAWVQILAGVILGMGILSLFIMYKTQKKERRWK